MYELNVHQVLLKSERLLLRPMTAQDWETLYRWNQDPEVLYYAEGADVTSYSMDQIQRIYSKVSQTAFCFIMELDGLPIGESWLQTMNLPRILEQNPGLDCRRIDLVIGEKAYWNQGFGTETIDRLVDFGFHEQGADRIFGCDIADHNIRSRHAFEKAGFRVAAKLPQPAGEKARFVSDLVIAVEHWRSIQDKTT